jgi:hypothetical protein
MVKKINYRKEKRNVSRLRKPHTQLLILNLHLSKKKLS